MLYLRDDFKEAWQGKDPFQLLMSMNGEIFRELEARRTFRFEHNGKGYFAKIHKGIGWLEIAENIIRLRKPVLGAQNEWTALSSLKSAGIDTMTMVAYGKKGCNPARQESFLVTEELKDMYTLEDFCDTWKEKPPSYVLKAAIIKKLAEISRQLHDIGINHRDYYLCHFMLSKEKKPEPDNLRFYLIDLHRAQVRKKVPERWRLKDISGLYYSAMGYNLTQRDIYRFIKTYTGLPLREALKQHDWMWKKIEEKAIKLNDRMKRKAGHPNY
ncbi:lipopolysaccharide core heptose(I) kinase RfaP [Endozoicomonas gorgoniicola]|uniref:Lipopolysaccharide core heptose(I) kinase n=1 Tax=Endozoicomonas gorgoniicola TaxID=1234144 RepID=A0ABT3N045_9GAMM|nr:lipopolysaccharide core heptose(I) kinase RfaP [Endozoicomonas gorgoniicola]MCW7555010.1 lipopolysaccharide core heptose(I) kinase RfaP [Endozoicomonas gorgoniicola]